MLLTESQLRNHIYERVKTMLTEGSWGYEPTQSDSYGDTNWVTLKKIAEMIYDDCEKGINRYNGTKHEYFDKGMSCWDSIGIIENFFESLASIDSTYKNKKGHEKYYVWWALLRDEKKSIVGLYKKCVDYCANNEKWIEGWKEPDKMRKSLKKRQQILKKYEQYLIDEYNEELKHENWRVEHEDEGPFHEKHKCTKTMKKYGGIDFPNDKKKKK